MAQKIIMNKLLKSKILLGVMIVAVMVVGVAVFATPASASDCMVTAPLKVGSSGAQVMCLQEKIGATQDGMFGPMTRAKVMAFQTNNGLMADGIVGPATRAALAGSTTTTTTTTTETLCPNGMTLASNCMTSPEGSTTTTTTTTTTLTGTSGEISDINQLSQYSNEEVGEGTEDVKILGFDVEASKDGDVKLNSIKLTFDSNGNNSADSDRIADYLDTVKVLMGTKEIGSASLSDFNKDSTGVYSKTITLTDAIVKAEVTEKFYVSVDAVSNLDSGDIDFDSWTIAINNLRYQDGSGVVTTVDSADTLLAGNMDYDAAGDGVGIAFVSFSTASDIELKISLDSSSPDSQVVEVSTTNDTSDVVLLKGKMKLTGDSDVTLDAVPVTFTIANETDISAVTPTVKLTIDGQEFSESVSDTDTSEVVVFDNLDLTIEAGDTVDFTVSADLNDIEASTFDEGTTLTATLGETETDLATFDALNEAGDALADDEKTGTATGEAQAFYSQGIKVSLVSVTNSAVSQAEVENTTDSVTITYKFDVTAFGAPIYVDGTVTEDGDGTYGDGQGVSYYSTRADTGADATSLTTIAAALTSTEATSSSNTTWLVDEDTTDTFTFTATMSNTLTDDGANDELMFQLALKAIGWDTTAIAATTHEYTFDMGDYISDAVSLGELDAA